MIHKFKCHQCGEDKTHECEFSTGYGLDVNGNKICFSCCGKNDEKELAELKPKQKFTLYLDTVKKTLTNWPGTLVIPIGCIREGKHNIARKRFDVWFKFNGNNYHATQYGTTTQIAHVKRIA